MESLQARLQTFSKSQRVKQAGKRNTVVKWPHPTEGFIATPDALAEAGFYFCPSAEDRDSVACFMCAKELSGWEDEDDPFLIHWEKCAERCAWAAVRCGLTQDVDRKGNWVFKDGTRAPASKAMEKARLATFKTNDRWPHDATKGHGASSVKMAKAGFVYTPQSSGDDTATCLYCNVSLSGWDPEDDPLEEHRKRESTSVSCPFLDASTSSPVPEPAHLPKANTAKPRAPTSRTSSRPPASRASSRPPARSASRKPVDDDDESISDAEPAPPPAPKRGRTPSTTVAKNKGKEQETLRRSTRGRTVSESVEVEDEASGSELKRSVRGKGKAKAQEKEKERIQVIEEEEEDSEDLVVKKGAKKKDEGLAKSTRAKGKGKAKETDQETEDEVTKPKAKRGRPKKVVPETDEEEDAVKRGRSKKAIEGEEKPKTTRRATTVKGKAKAKSKAAFSEQEDTSIETEAGEDKPKKGRKPKAQKTQAVVEIVSGSEDEEDEVLPVVKPKGKSKAHPAPNAVEIADVEVEVLTAVPDLRPSPSEDSTSSSKRSASTKPQSKARPKAAAKAAKESPDPLEDQMDLDEERPSVKPPRATKPVSKARNGTITPSEGSTTGSTRSKSSKKVPTEAPAKSRTTSAEDRMDIDEPAPSKPKSALSSQRSFSSEAREVKMDDIEPRAKPEIHFGAAPVRLPSPVRPPRSPLRPRSKEIQISPSPSRSPSPSPARMPMAPSTPPRAAPPSPPPASSSLPPLPSFDSAHSSPHMNGTGGYIAMPMQALSEAERMMTVEQWIRHEIDVQYERLRKEGETKIRLFRERAEEVRRRIEAL